MGCGVSDDRPFYGLHHSCNHHRSSFADLRTVLEEVPEEDEESVQEGRQIRPHARRSSVDSNLMNDHYTQSTL